MANYNTTNIKNLPQLEEVVEGNYLIIEDNVGTNIIDFADFVVGPNNVSFYNVVEALSTRSISMSSTVDSKFNTLSGDLINSVDTKLDAFTSAYQRTFNVYPATLTIRNGSSYGQSTFNSPINSIITSDINVIPTNDSASKTNWILSLSSTVYPGSPTPFTYTITISSSTVASSNATFETRALKFY
jgi:hypothetical protein